MIAASEEYSPFDMARCRPAGMVGEWAQCVKPAMILALDSSGEACAAGLFADRQPIVERSERMDRGQAARLPMLVAELIGGYGPINLIAVTVGPGSFTGLRGSLALAHGLATGWGCGLVGVTVIEAIAHGITAAPLWVALHSRAGHVFLGHDGRIESLPLKALPEPAAGTIVTGNAAAAVVALLAARGHTVGLVEQDNVPLAAVAAIGQARNLGNLPSCATLPVYVDAPLAKLPKP